MDKRERFARTLRHETPDRPPLDFAGTSLTAYADPSVLTGLAAALDIRGETADAVKEAVLRRLGTDFRNIGYIFHPNSPLTKQGNGWYTDCWGITRQYTGMYWDITGYPLKDASMADLEAFPWPDAAHIDRAQFGVLREQAKRLYNDTDYVIVGEHPVLGVLELGCWMCSFDDFLYRLLGEPEFTQAFFAHVYRYQQDVIGLYYEAVGDYLHVTTSGDDFGTQNGPFMSESVFRDMVMPWYEKRISLTKQLTGAAYFHHTCGSVYRLLGALYDMGVDILNPLQPGAFEMDFAAIKREYGSRLVFWGGIDEQGYLTSGTPEAVASGVRQVLEIMSGEGGYVAAPSHNIQPDVPAENVLAFCRAVEEWAC